MGVEIEGNLGSNDYKLKKLAQSLRQKDLQISALRTQLEQTQRLAEERIGKLESSVAFWKKRYASNVKPRKMVETKAEAQGVRDSVGEDPVSPSIST